jgi:hypothetical protein
MYRSGLVPRGIAVLGLTAGPVLCAAGIAMMFDVFEPGSLPQVIASAPEFVWESSLGIYLMVKDSSRLRSSPAIPELPEWARVQPRRKQASPPNFNRR